MEHEDTLPWDTSKLQSPSLAIPIRMLDMTKADIGIFCDDVVRSVLNGETNPLEAHLFIKKLEKIVDTIKEDDRMKSIILDEAMKNPHGKPFIYHGAECRIKEAGARYDYSKSGDPYWQKYKDALDERQKFLQNLPPEGVELLEPETGEIVQIIPPPKSSTTVVEIRFK